MEVSIEPVGADRCVGPDTFLRGTRSRADTQVRPYAGDGRCSGTNGERCENGPRTRGGTKARPLQGTGAGLRRRGKVTPPFRCSRRGGAPSPPVLPGLMEVSIGPVGADRCVGPNTLLRGTRPQADTQVRPYREKGRFPRPPRPAAHSGASAPRMGGRGWNCGRDHPQSVQQLRTIPQSRLRRASSLYTREPLGTGDADCRVGPSGLLAMTMVFCHSEERSDVGIRTFTMDGGSGRRT